MENDIKNCIYLVLCICILKKNFNLGFEVLEHIPKYPSTLSSPL